MLIHWLIARLCRNTSEMRVVLRSARRWCATPPHSREAVRDRRITRRWRLSLLWALLVMFKEAEHTMVLGVFSMCGLSIIALLRVGAYLWSIV